MSRDTVTAALDALREVLGADDLERLGALMRATHCVERAEKEAAELRQLLQLVVLVSAKNVRREA